MIRQAVIILVFFLTACTVEDDTPIFVKDDTDYHPVIVSEKPLEVQLYGNCQHIAVFCMAMASSYGYETKAILGYEDLPEGLTRHVQAQAKINGKWLWLFSLGRVKIVGKESFYDHLGHEFFTDQDEPPLSIEDMVYFIQYEWYGDFR